MDRIADFRRVFAQVVMARADCRDPAIHEAFARVPRHEFVGPGPWYFTEQGGPAESDDPAILYQDVGMALARDRGIPTGLPSLHARCIAACAVRAGERVIHIGAGSGYYTAILAELVGEAGQVVAFEIDEDLAARARQNLRTWPWARVESMSAVAIEGPEADVIYACAGVEELPQGWLKALRSGGRLLFPLVPNGEEGAMLLVRDIGSPALFSAEFICPARFVPCIGAQDEEARDRLARAFRLKNHESVRSLGVHPAEPGDSPWFSGSGFWLSTMPAEPDALHARGPARG